MADQDKGEIKLKGVRPRAVDPDVFEDLRTVEQCLRLFGYFGVRLKSWEAFTLLKSNRKAVEDEISRLSKFKDITATRVDAGVVKKIEDIRRDLGPLAGKLHPYLERSPVPLDHIRLELCLTFIMSSVKGREAAARWVEDPEAQPEAAIMRIRVMTSIVDAYRLTLQDARSLAPPEPPKVFEDERPLQPAPLPASAPLPRVEPAPEEGAKKGVNLKMLENIRFMRGVRNLLKDLEPVEGWEAMTLLVSDRNDTLATARELVRLKKEGKPGEFAGEAYRLREKLSHIRAQFGVFVHDLRVYFERIFGKWEGEEREIALMFLVSSRQGRHRARQWLDDPDLCAEEAATTAEGLLARARMYLEALDRRQPAKPSEGSPEPGG